MTKTKALWMICLLWVTQIFAAPATPFGAPASNILPAEKAFQVMVDNTTPESVTLDFLIAPHTYLYQKSFRFMANAVVLGAPVFPKAKQIKDPFLGETDIYRDKVRVTVPISPPATQSFTLEVTYQGCHDVGFCYPPQTSMLTVTPAQTNEVAPHVTASPFDILSTHNGWALLAFMGFGILLSFTPCVLPMVPILSVLILGEQQKHHPLKAFTLALAYVMGMALTYAALGALVGSVGARVQVQWQNPWVLSGVAALLVIFAGMLIHHKPQAFLSRLSGRFHHIAHALPGGEYLSVALMGVLASLVISPCVTPPLVGALTYITMAGNMWFGSAALFMLGLGMGLPLLVVTWLGTAILPKRGQWMERVKHLLAVMLLVMAIELLARFLPEGTGLLLYGALAMGVGFWLKPFQVRRGMGRMWQALAWLSLLMGVLWIIGGAQGNSDWRAPLKMEKAKEPALSFTVVKTPEALIQRLMDAHVVGKPAFVEFYADWCVACVYMERTVLTGDAVRALLEPYALIKVDLTETNEDTHLLLKAWDLFGPPAFLFFDASGQELKSARLNGEVSQEAFIHHLENIRPSSLNKTPSSKN